VGSNLATELASGDLDVSLRDSIAIQLRSNHYPPVPLSMIDPCIEAIEACNDEDYDKLIKLPEGVSWRGQDSAPANAIVEGHHLDAWVNHAWYCDCSDCIGDAE
jgi:hypothetical protein